MSDIIDSTIGSTPRPCLQRQTHTHTLFSGSLVSQTKKPTTDTQLLNQYTLYSLVPASTTSPGERNDAGGGYYFVVRIKLYQYTKRRYVTSAGANVRTCFVTVYH